MSHVFPRVLDRILPTAVRAEGAAIWDADGKRYLDAAGGAIVVGIGHGDERVVCAMAGRDACALDGGTGLVPPGAAALGIGDRIAGRDGDRGSSLGAASTMAAAVPPGASSVVRAPAMAGEDVLDRCRVAPMGGE